MEEVCEDMIRENKVKWKRRRLEEEVIKKMEERELEKKLKYEKQRRERIEKASKKKEELLARLEKKRKIVIVKEGKSAEWVKQKQECWRKYRERKRIDSDENRELLQKIIEKIPERKIGGNGDSEIGDLNLEPTLPSTPLLVEGGSIEIGEGLKSPKEVDPLDPNVKALKNPLFPSKLKISSEYYHEGQRIGHFEKKNWASFGEAFCQYHENLDKADTNIKKIGPKSVKKIDGTGQNAGIFDLVAKDRDKDYPPVNPR